MRGQLARARRRQTGVAVMVAGYADLDWLAEAFVPSAIERLCERAAERLALRVHGGDVLARLDDERGVVLGLEACVGISLYPGVGKGSDPDSLLENATAAWEDADSHDGVTFHVDGKRDQ